MKRLVITIVALVWMCGALAQTRAEQIRATLEDIKSDRVLVASHRGDWRGYPENSLEGIMSAIAMGVDIVEIDLQRTKDGELILMHDGTLNRCTTGKGKISDWTLDSIRGLKLKNGVGIRTRYRVPTLEEVLLATKGKAMLNLDKADRYFEQVMALLEKTGTTRQIVMKGSRPAEEVNAAFGKYLQQVIYMPIVNLDKANAESQIESFVKEMKPVALELLYESDTNALAWKLAKDLKASKIWYNCLWDTMAGGHDDDASLVDKADGWGFLIDKMHARLLQTDRPEMLINYLRARGLHE